MEQNIVKQLTIDVQLPLNNRNEAQQLLDEAMAFIEGNEGYEVLGSNIKDVTQEYKRNGFLAERD